MFCFLFFFISISLLNAISVASWSLVVYFLMSDCKQSKKWLCFLLWCFGIIGSTRNTNANVAILNDNRSENKPYKNSFLLLFFSFFNTYLFRFMIIVFLYIFSLIHIIIVIAINLFIFPLFYLFKCHRQCCCFFCWFFFRELLAVEDNNIKNTWWCVVEDALFYCFVFCALFCCILFHIYLLKKRWMSKGQVSVEVTDGAWR